MEISENAKIRANIRANGIYGVFAGYERYLLLPETHEIEGDTLHVSRTGVQYPLSVSLIYLLYTFIYAKLTYGRRNETRLKSPDACNAFFIKVSTRAPPAAGMLR